MRNFFVVVSFSAFFISCVCFPENLLDDIRGDENLSLYDVIKKHGYPVEIHEIQTEDGYLLDTYRIPHGRNGVKIPNEYPVMVNHGIMGSAERFVIGGPKKGLAYVLADKGYDVWLLNARGSWHSRKHKYLNPDKDPQFWRFTWHEIGYYDLPNTVDYILQYTNQEKLHYIGHSQGSTTFFVMASERPEYNKKIKLSVALAPIANLKNIKEPISKALSPMYSYFSKLVETSKMYEMMPKQVLSNEVVRSIGKGFCGQNNKRACSNILFFMSGTTPEVQLDPDTIPYIAATIPSGAAVYQGVHFAQVTAKGRFEKFDWGPEENMKRYHSKYPPEYNLKNVTCPVSLIYGDNDDLATKEDVMELAHILPNVVDVYRIPFDKWTHMDFIWAKDIDIYMNGHVLEILHRFN